MFNNKVVFLIFGVVAIANCGAIHKHNDDDVDGDGKSINENECKTKLFFHL